MSTSIDDICNDKNDKTNGCPADLPPDPKNTCEKIKNQYDVLIQQSKDYVKSAEVITNGFTLSGLLKELGTRNKSNIKLQNVITNYQQSSQTSDIDNKCGNKNTNVQQNIIEDTTDCVKIQGENIASLKDNPEALRIYLESLGANNIDQENTTESKQQCVLNNYIAAMKKIEASVESAALLKVMQKSSDLFASSETEMDMCNNVNNTVSSCQYIKSNLCCVNDSNSSQLNLIKCKSANKVTQRNVNKALQICNLTGSTTVDASLIAKLKNSVSADISQTATGTSLMSFVLLLAVIILGPPLGVGLFSFFLPKEIVVAFFGILCIIIGIVLLNMHKPLPERPEFINKTRDMPIFAAKYFKPNSSYQPKAQSEIKPIKYNAAKKKINDNQDIKEDDVGVPVFYNSTKDGYCEEEIEDEKNTYFTNYKPHTPTPYDIYGKLLIGLGGFLILMGMYLLFKTKTTLPSGGKENYKKIK